MTAVASYAPVPTVAEPAQAFDVATPRNDANGNEDAAPHTGVPLDP